MKLEIRLFATLRELVPKETRGVVLMDFPENTQVKDVVEALKVPEDISLIILVNGRRALEDYVLQDGDRVGIFPPVGGG